MGKARDAEAQFFGLWADDNLMIYAVNNQDIQDRLLTLERFECILEGQLCINMPIYQHSNLSIFDLTFLMSPEHVTGTGDLFQG